jgi:hypothetical protein
MIRTSVFGRLCRVLANENAAGSILAYHLAIVV